MANICCAPWKIRNFLKLVAFVLVVMLLVGVGAYYMQYRDRDPDRGAIAMPEKDAMGDFFSKVVYLNQGWGAEKSLWFYNTTQGSDLVPYDFFIALEQEGNTTLFRDNANINRYRYLPQKPTSSNPDGLPVGFVEDNYKGVKYVGFTCAACHTGQVNYQGTAIRIDGGPAGADMESFVRDLGASLDATLADKEKLKRFTTAVMARGNYRTSQAVADDLATYAALINTYVLINDPTLVDGDGQGAKGAGSSHYYYGRLDAFGRIYNRVLEHVISPDQLETVLRSNISAHVVDYVMKGIRQKDKILTNKDRDLIYQRLIKCASQKDPACKIAPKELKLLAGEVFNPANAAVSYPFLWDVPQSDYVQWNGLAANAGVGPLGRNAGEVIGVFGNLDWTITDKWSLSAALNGEGWFNQKRHVDYTSSVDVHNLRRIEHQLASLQSPPWPADILGKLDQARVDRGSKLFDKNCQACHAEIHPSSPERRVVANITKVEAIGTDPTMADNSVSYIGYSGILRNFYVDTPAGVGSVLIQQKAPVAALLTKADQNVLVTPDPDKWWISSALERAYDFVVSLRDNDIKASIKQGNYTPATTSAPFADLRSYKGRSLNGIWATAPYLHNGSVPTLYDVLLPKKGECVSKDGVYRPNTFKVGSREYDPVHVGFVTRVGHEFDTSLINNGNGGHNYGNCEFSEQDRLDLVEYMKSL